MPEISTGYLLSVMFVDIIRASIHDRDSCMFAVICLSVWTIRDGLKYACFYLGGVIGMCSPILVSTLDPWMSELKLIRSVFMDQLDIADSTAERDLVISSKMSAEYCTFIWVRTAPTR
jgi:ACS family pantothenate transporter-like MFS transporter